MKLKFGLIGEDNGHIDCLISILKKMCNTDRISSAKFIGNGCGKVKRKAGKWAMSLKTKGCNRLILIHDLDRNNLESLSKALSEALDGNPISKSFICIPIEEIETWIISDLEIVYKHFGIRKKPKEFSNPEKICSPKEKIGEIVKKASDGEKVYLHTKHNQLIIEQIRLEKMRKCPQFNKLEEFVRANCV